MYPGFSFQYVFQPHWGTLAYVKYQKACVMNFITYDTAYSLYPWATFEERQNLALVNTDGPARQCLAKYARRGWSTLANVWPHSPDITASFFVDVDRHCQDRHAWRLPLNMTGVQVPARLSPTSEALTWDPSAYNSWKLTYAHESWVVSAQSSLLRSGVLRYAYTCADKLLMQALKGLFDSEWDSQLAKAELMTADDKANSWVWWDSVIPVVLGDHT